MQNACKDADSNQIVAKSPCFDLYFFRWIIYAMKRVKQKQKKKLILLSHIGI